MKRLFTFGCSFTSYSWSTWADIIGQDFDFFENWGQLGAGNQYIFNSIVECNQHYRFTKRDTVVVCWTNIFREDRYIYKWRGVGNLYTQELYDRQWVKQFVTERGHLIRDIASIKAVKTMLEHWQVSWKFLAMVPIDQTDKYRANQRPHNLDVLDLYQDVVGAIAPSYWEVLKDRPKASFDLHPLPADHLYYVDQILPEFKVSDQTRQAILDEDQTIRLLGKIPSYNPPEIERL
jgi:hypothetical protein